MKEVILWGAGLLTTLIGFGAKWMADYLWLKSPTLRLKTKPVKGYVETIEGQFVIKFDCSILIFNHSKNESYGFEVCNIVFDNMDIQVIESSIKVPERSITDQDSFRISFSCFNPNVTVAKGQVTVSNRELILNESFTLTCVYYNQLGKSYKKSFTSLFKELEKDRFFVA
jgi:hypothetical protein